MPTKKLHDYVYNGKHDTFVRSSPWRKTWNSDFYLESPTSFNQQNISDSTVHIYSHSHKEYQCNWAADSQKREITLKWHCIIWRNDFLGPHMTSKWRYTVTNEVQGSSTAVNTPPPPVMFICAFTSYSTAAWCDSTEYELIQSFCHESIHIFGPTSIENNCFHFPEPSCVIHSRPK